MSVCRPIFLKSPPLARLRSKLRSNVVEAKELISLLGLEPLPREGGYFRQTYRSSQSIPGLDRRVSTAIYYLVTPESFSALHRLKQDEIFHFYTGDPVEMIQLTDSGEVQSFILGNDLSRGQVPQKLAAGGIWQGTKLIGNGKWALLGTTVAPGFEYEDDEVPTREQLLQHFPQHHHLIVKFTHEEVIASG